MNHKNWLAFKDGECDDPPFQPMLFLSHPRKKISLVHAQPKGEQDHGKVNNLPNPGEKCLGDGDMINMEDGVTSNVINMVVEEPMATVLS